MRILLMRHGEPDAPQRVWLTSAGMAAWVAAYDRASLRFDSQLAQESLAQCSITSFVVSSDLPRAVDSARRVMQGAPHVTSPDFREAALPLLNVPALRLPPPCWLALFRLAWLTGYSFQVESRKAFSVRIQRAVASLVSYAEQYGDVVLVAHGVLIHYLTRELQRAGWARQTGKVRGYWSCVEMTRQVGV